MLLPTLVPETDEAEQKKLSKEDVRSCKSKHLEQVMPFTIARCALVVGDTSYDIVATAGSGMAAAGAWPAKLRNDALNDAAAVALNDEVTARVAVSRTRR